MSDIVQGDYRESRFVYRDPNTFHPVNSKWIDELPAEWSLIKLDRCLETLQSGSREKHDGDDGVFSIGGEHIDDRGNIKKENERFISTEFYESLNGGQIREGDVLLVKDGATIGKTAYVENIPHGEAAANSHVYILRGKDIIDNRYLYYSVKSEFIQTQIDVSITGSAQEGLSRKFTKFVELPLPPVAEQNAISSFLDGKVNQINELIDYKSKMMTLLEEKRGALISKAVTKGISPDEEMEESGIPGVGEIPESWDLLPLKYSSRNITSGSREISKYYVDDGVPTLRAINIEKNEIDTDDLVYISEKSNQELSTSQLNAGDVVSVRRGDHGTTAVIPEELDGANCVNLVIIRKPEGYIPEFLSFLMNSEASKSQIQAETTGATLTHLNVEAAKELVFPRPDLEEQREILDWLSPRLKDIDELEEKILDAIERLREYRNALITEAVTGQIDVRGEI